MSSDKMKIEFVKLPDVKFEDIVLDECENEYYDENDNFNNTYYHLYARICDWRI